MARTASMKALPKRKGNPRRPSFCIAKCIASMKALPKRKGNYYSAGDGFNFDGPQ